MVTYVIVRPLQLGDRGKPQPAARSVEKRYPYQFYLYSFSHLHRILLNSDKHKSPQSWYTWRLSDNCLFQDLHTHQHL